MGTLSKPAYTMTQEFCGPGARQAACAWLDKMRAERPTIAVGTDVCHLTSDTLTSAIDPTEGEVWRATVIYERK